MMENKVKGFSIAQFVLLCIVASVHCIREPLHCSQYHFLEQLLDKMIRTEVKLEEIQKHVDEQLKQMKVSLSSFEEKHDRMYAEVEKVALALKELPQADELLVPTVVFNARDVADQTVDNGQKYVFTNVDYNHGDGYDVSTGTFTAPVDGTYMFTTNLCVKGGSYVCYDIKYEGQSLSRGVENGSGGGNPCNAIGAVVVLTAGESVWVESTYDTSYLSTDRFRMNSFAGALINQ